MLQRIKDFFNSTVLWAALLVGAVFYFWRKDDDLENKLEETRSNDEIQKDKQGVADADNRAADAVSNFQRLSEQYEHEHPND